MAKTLQQYKNTGYSVVGIQKDKTTKFEITMTVEVVDVGDVPADPESLRDTITTEIEGISSGNVVKVKSIMVTGKS